MTNDFQVESLPRQPFVPLFALADHELESRSVKRVRVDAKPGFPCRVSLVDAEIGEDVLLLEYVHHDVRSPYRSSGAIFVRQTAQEAELGPNELPAMLHHRLLSIRGYDRDAVMVAATTANGSELRPVIDDLFEDPTIEYLHIHNARPGCFNCSVRRV